MTDDQIARKIKILLQKENEIRLHIILSSVQKFLNWLYENAREIWSAIVDWGKGQITRLLNNLF